MSDTDTSDCSDSDVDIPVYDGSGSVCRKKIMTPNSSVSTSVAAASSPSFEYELSTSMVNNNNNTGHEIGKLADNAINASSETDVEISDSEEVKTDTSFKLHEKLREHYSYCGSVIIPGKRVKILLKCHRCNEKPPKHGMEDNLSNFTRHLKTAHNIIVTLGLVKNQNKNPSVHSFLKPTLKLERSNPVQASFEEALIDLVAVDGLPFNITEGLGFQNLCSVLNDSVTIRSRRTLVRRVHKRAEDLKRRRNKYIWKDIPEKSVHIIADIWSSRQNEAVLGVKAQYLTKDYEMKNLTLGFSHFSERHTGENIEKMVKNVISSSGLNESQIGAIVADNASNMRKAFCVKGILEDKDCRENKDTSKINYARESEDDSEDVDDTGLSGIDQQDKMDFISTADFDNEESDSDMEWESDCGLQELMNDKGFTWEYHGCLSHKLQLVINTAIAENKEVKEMIYCVNRIIVKIRKSVYWTEKLKEKTGHCLLTIGTTRWNSIVTALERFAMDGVFTKLQQVLLDYNNAVPSTKRVSVPAFLTRSRIRELVNILLPFRQVTNILQSNSVSSSLVVPSILTLYSHCNKLESKFYTNFPMSLKNQLLSRFSKIISEKTWIVCSFLDPRQKNRPFGLEVDAMSACLPSKEDVKAIMEDLEKTVESDNIADIEQHHNIIPKLPTPKIKKSETVLPSVLTVLNDYEAKQSAVQLSEVERYIAECVESNDINLLVYWERNVKHFPRLSYLAKRFLAIPASSGDVERLFSVAGSLKRQRRNRLRIKNVEDILLIKDSRLPVLKKKLKRI